MPSRSRAVRPDALPAARLLLAGLGVAVLYAAFVAQMLTTPAAPAAPYRSILVEHGWSPDDSHPRPSRMVATVALEASSE
jgi:hypothetical protein